MKSIDQSKGYLGHHEEISNTEAEHREVVGGPHFLESENRYINLKKVMENKK